jgi:hypothetical protein
MLRNHDLDAAALLRYKSPLRAIPLRAKMTVFTHVAAPLRFCSKFAVVYRNPLTGYA